MAKHWVWIFVVLCASVAFWASMASSANKPVSSKLTAAELAKVMNGEVVLKNVINEQTNQGYGSDFCLFHGTVDQF
jgi:hypothetical protein